MIAGSVNENDEPVIEVKLDLGKEKRPVNAVIDTGFNGYICVPKKLIDKSDWEFLGIEEYELASGELMRERVFLGRVEMGPEKLIAFVLLTNSLRDDSFSLSFLRKQESREREILWIPAFAGMTYKKRG